MGETARSFTHLLSQPLAAVMNYAGALKRLSMADPQRAQDLLRVVERLMDQVKRSGRVLHALESAALRHRPARVPVNLQDALRGAIEESGERLRALGVDLDLRLPAELPRVCASPSYLGQILRNLLGNALDALESAPSPRLLGITLEASEHEVSARIADNAGGVPEAFRERIFEPFFTTRDGALGMGLPIARSLAEAQGGRLVLEDSPGGASLLLTLPVAEPYNPIHPAQK